MNYCSRIVVDTVVPLLAGPAVFLKHALLDKPAVAPTDESVISIENYLIMFLAKKRSLQGANIGGQFPARRS